MIKLVLILCLLVTLKVYCAPSQEAIGNNPFVGFFIFPHGGVVLDPETHNLVEEPGSKENTREEAIKLHKAMQLAAKSLMELRPDIVILSTPHGFYLENNFVFIANPSMSGNAGWSWSNFKANFTIDTKTTVALYLELLKEKRPVELLAFGIAQSDMQIMWGEVIPWYFVQEASIQLNIPLPQVIYIGQPPTKKTEELKTLGRDITTFGKQHLSHKKIVVLISGDLSHYHSKNPKAPYPFNENSVVFDNFIRDWAKMDRNEETEKSSNIILKNAEDVSSEAGSCGLPGFLMLNSMITSLVEDGNHFKAKFYEISVPTYFGMVVTSWIPY